MSTTTPAEPDTEEPDVDTETVIWCGECPEAAVRAATREMTLYVDMGNGERSNTGHAMICDAPACEQKARAWAEYQGYDVSDPEPLALPQPRSLPHRHAS